MNSTTLITFPLNYDQFKDKFDFKSSENSIIMLNKTIQSEVDRNIELQIKIGNLILDYTLNKPNKLIKTNSCYSALHPSNSDNFELNLHSNISLVRTVSKEFSSSLSENIKNTENNVEMETYI